MEIISAFKGLEVIMISLGGILFIYLGYRLLIKGTNQAFTIFSNLKGWKFKAANIAPGILFAIIGSLVLCSPVITNTISIFQQERFINTYATKLILAESRKKNDIILNYRLNNKTHSTNSTNKDASIIGDLVIERSKESNKAVVTCNVLHTRKGPSIHYQIFDLLRKGDIITVKETRGLWLRISTDEFSDGWVDGNYVKRLENPRRTEPAKSTAILSSHSKLITPQVIDKN